MVKISGPDPESSLESALGRNPKVSRTTHPFICPGLGFLSKIPYKSGNRPGRVVGVGGGWSQKSWGGKLDRPPTVYAWLICTFGHSRAGHVRRAGFHRIFQNGFGQRFVKIFFMCRGVALRAHRTGAVSYRGGGVGPMAFPNGSGCYWDAIGMPLGFGNPGCTRGLRVCSPRKGGKNVGPRGLRI